MHAQCIILDAYSSYEILNRQLMKQLDSKTKETLLILHTMARSKLSFTLLFTLHMHYSPDCVPLIIDNVAKLGNISYTHIS